MLRSKHLAFASAFALVAASVLASCSQAPPTTAAPEARPTPYEIINQAAATSPINVTTLRGNVSMLDGSGGNIAVLTGPEGLFLVDAGIDVSEQKIADALRGLSPGRVQYVVNTHWHWDHTDGNGWARRAGATIIAESNAVARLQQSTRVEEWNHTFAPVSAADLPNRAISEDLTMTYGGETILIRRYVPGHTDGDLSVYFRNGDVLVTGDTFWNGVYPFIDYVGGGGIDGAIREADVNLAMAGANTIIVPGHGPIANRADAQAFRDMLVAVRDRIKALKAQGMTLEQVQAARPTADYDERWGGSVITGEMFTALVYRGV